MTEEDIKRLYYYNRQYLGFKDFQDEQKYHMDMRRRHNIAHHTWGIVVGLEISQYQTSKVWSVQPGIAVDGFGREIVVFVPEPLDTIKIADQLAGAPLPARLKVWLSYDVERSNPPSPGYEVCDGKDQFTRIREKYQLIYKDSPSFNNRDLDDRQTWPQASEELPDDPDEAPWPVYLGTIVWDTDPENPSHKVIRDVEFVDTRDDKERVYMGIIGGALTLGPSGNELLRGDDPGTKAPTGEPNNGLLIQSAQTIEINIDSNDIPEDMFAVTKGSARTEVFRIQEDGNVGIGTINPDAKLDVNGNIKRQGHTVLDCGNTRVASMIFEPSSYWSGASNADVAGFSLSINVPTSGTLLAHMNALVQMSAAGKAIYLGPKINGAISLGNRGGYRAKNDSDPQWLGTAAFNLRQVLAGSHTVQVHANIDGGTAQVAWGSLMVQFFPD